MKLTKQRLNQIIQEEYTRMLTEASDFGSRYNRGGGAAPYRDEAPEQAGDDYAALGEMGPTVSSYLQVMLRSKIDEEELASLWDQMLDASMLDNPGDVEQAMEQVMDQAEEDGFEAGFVSFHARKMHASMPDGDEMLDAVQNKRIKLAARPTSAPVAHTDSRYLPGGSA